MTKILRYTPQTPWTVEEKAWLKQQGDVQIRAIRALISDGKPSVYTTKQSCAPNRAERAWFKAFCNDPYVQEAVQAGLVKLPDPGPANWYHGARATNETSLQFLLRVWGEFIRHGLMSEAILGKIDPQLRINLLVLCSRRGNTTLDAVLLPHDRIKSSLMIKPGARENPQARYAAVAGILTAHRIKPESIELFAWRQPRLHRDADGDMVFGYESAMTFFTRVYGNHLALNVKELSKIDTTLMIAIYKELQQMPQENIVRAVRELPEGMGTNFIMCPNIQAAHRRAMAQRAAEKPGAAVTPQ